MTDANGDRRLDRQFSQKAQQNNLLLEGFENGLYRHRERLLVTSQVRGSAQHHALLDTFGDSLQNRRHHRLHESLVARVEAFVEVLQCIGNEGERLVSDRGVQARSEISQNLLRQRRGAFDDSLLDATGVHDDHQHQTGVADRDQFDVADAASFQ